MPYETDRLVALEEDLLFRTNDMVDWLGIQAGLEEELSEALLGAWVGMLRNVVLHQAEQNEDVLKAVETGSGTLTLDRELAPKDSDKTEAWSQIAQETGLPYNGLRPLLRLIGERLRGLQGKKAFEPIGWFTSTDNDDFSVTLWRDFLQPVSYESFLQERK